MFFFPGLWPAVRTFCALILLSCMAHAFADSRVPLTLAEAEDIALNDEHGHLALVARADALREQSIAAGQLPDPTLRVGLANYPINGGNFTTEGMTQAQLGIRQAFPKGNSRALATTQYLAKSRGQQFAADVRQREVLAAARSAWLDSYYWHNARQVLVESRTLFADLVTITQSLYSVGRKSQYDVLRAELELSRLDDRLIEADREMANAQAMLLQWIGDDAYRTPANKFPEWETPPSLPNIQAELADHPRMLAAEAEVDALQASVMLAEENKKPGWAFDVGYGFRDGTLPNGKPRSDFISMSVTVDLPLFSKNRQDRKLASALSERSAARSDRDRTLAEMSSNVAARHAHWQELTRRIELYETTILTLSSLQAEAAMLAYESDNGTFSDVMLGYIDKLNTQLEHILLEVERAKAYTALANLGGLPR